jgi:Ca2+-binding EF-hand superfamily protein
MRARALACACFVMAAWLAFGSPAVCTGAPFEPADDVQDLFFLGGGKCTLVRLHIQIGERPLSAAWHDAVAKLHACLDSGGAGSVGLEEELAEFGEMLRGPLAVRVLPSESDQDTTFARIDANGDGALGPDEWARVAVVLRRFDLNDDELISSAELTAYRDPNSDPPAQPSRADAEPPVLLLDRSVSRIRTVQQVLSRFDIGGTGGARPKDQRLSRSEIHLAPEVFRAFDSNHDGSLDSVELMQFLDQGDPAVELIVRLGARASKREAVEIIADRRRQSPASASAPRAWMRGGDEPVVTIELGDVVIDVRIEDTSWDTAQLRKTYERLFDDIDADENKSISRAEARGQEPFQALFRVMDHNADGQIVRDEMNAALVLFEDLWRGHALLSVKDRGVRLFGNLDTSGDGKLSLRELRAASARLASFDRNADGKVTKAEIPHRYELTLSQAPPPLGVVIRDPDRPTAGAPRPVAVAGPIWFQKMDRNHDGDLSPREFLGPRAEFLRLDADLDGLIDAREATAAHAQAP